MRIVAFSAIMCHMKQEARNISEEKEEAPDVTPVEPEQKGIYDLHIKVPEELRQKLKDATDLAYKMDLIAKPDLIDLMNLWIGWGFAILKKQWKERAGYR